MENKFIEHNIKMLTDGWYSRKGDTFTNNSGYKCVNCGKEVSPATVKFYKSRDINNFEKIVKCYGKCN